MSTPIKTPPSVNTSEDPGLEYLNQREIEVAITPVENTTKDIVFEEVTQVITNVFQFNAPSGANGQLQFNQNGSYIGDAELQYDPNTDTLTTGKIIANSITITGNVSTFKLPGGNNNDVLKTDGTGNLSWANVFPSVSGKSGKFLVTNGVSIDWSNGNYNSFATTSYVDSAIATLVGTSPAMLDTLAEIANVIGQTNDPQFGIISQLANKANISSLSQVAFSGSYADLSNRPNISTVGNTGNYSDLNGIPTIPTTINDLGISDGTVGQVLTTRGNGTYHFTTVTSGSNANIGNIKFDNNIIYSNTGVVINNSDLNNGQTAGMAIPVQGDGNTAALYNIYGNVTVLAGNIGNSQPVQAWTFSPGGALFFPQTPYVTSAILVNDNNQELSVSTDRGSVSIWPENSKWLFGADGRLTFPKGTVIDGQENGVQITGAGLLAVNRFYPKVSNTLYEAVDAGVTYRLVNQSGTWSLDIVGESNPQYTSTDLIAWTASQGAIPAPIGAISTQETSLTVGTSTWTFGADGNLTLPTGGDILDSTGNSVLGGGFSGNYSDLSNKPNLLVYATAANLSTLSNSVANITWANLSGAPTIPTDVSDLTDTTNLLGGGSASTGNITFSGDNISGSDNVVRIRSLNTTTTASYSFTPGVDYSTAVWDADAITFNDPTQAIYDAIWALTNLSTIQVQVAGTWFTVTSTGSSTPGMPQAPTLFINQTAVGGPLNIDVVDISIRQGTESYVEIDGSDFRVDVQDDIRIYGNDTFLLYNKSTTDPIRIETNNGSHQWSFNSEGDLILPAGGDIKNDNGNSLLFSGSYNDLSDTPSFFGGDYDDLTDKPTSIQTVSAGSGPGGNDKANSLVLTGLNPTENVPSTYGGDIILQPGVGGSNGDLYGEVRIKSGTIGANYEWHFTTDKKLKLPAGGDIVDSTGAGVLGGSGSYTPADATSWATPAPTTIAQALDRLAVLMKTLNSGTGA